MCNKTDEEAAQQEFNSFLDTPLFEELNHTAFFLTGIPKYVAVGILLGQFGIEVEDALMYHCPQFICEMSFDCEVDRLQDAEEDEDEKN